ncbi:PREDICTED: uncharacterized protein LOC105535881 [Mandrillus leucophaeus]|uniref:uncharacterized protein LOC105535881 n=1 Tax=Mandrillus leucophaeus TaxID=9568 RepID=UPI0005F553DF|nr:PREDICTED: uncharacterized protein LOC105535881 [Mandrillus leucophaeus]
MASCGVQPGSTQSNNTAFHGFEDPGFLPIFYIGGILTPNGNCAVNNDSHGDIIVQAPTQVPGFLGDSVTLPCYLQVPDMEVTHVSQLTWSRHGESGSMAVFHQTQGPNYSEPKRLEFVAARLGTELRDASLRMFGLRVEDEGNYTCLFVTFPQGSRSVDIWLRVLARLGHKQHCPYCLHQFTRAIVNADSTIPIVYTSYFGHQLWGVFTALSKVPLDTVYTDSLENCLHSPPTLYRPVPLSQDRPSLPAPDSICAGSPAQRYLQQLPHGVINIDTHTFISTDSPRDSLTISGYDNNWYLSQNEATLTCDARSNPEPTGYNWST